MDASTIFADIPTTLTINGTDLVRKAHANVLSDREARNLARDLAREVVTDDTLTMVTNTDARPLLLAAIEPVSYPTLCPRCATRGRKRHVGHTDDWEVCHVPFIKGAAGFGNTSPLEWLAIGCRTCNREDADWGVAY